jgi:hypothetical protein
MFGRDTMAEPKPWTNSVEADELQMSRHTTADFRWSPG